MQDQQAPPPLRRRIKRWLALCLLLIIGLIPLGWTVTDLYLVMNDRLPLLMAYLPRHDSVLYAQCGSPYRAGDWGYFHWSVIENFKGNRVELTYNEDSAAVVVGKHVDNSEDEVFSRKFSDAFSKDQIISLNKMNDIIVYSRLPYLYAPPDRNMLADRHHINEAALKYRNFVFFDYIDERGVTPDDMNGDIFNNIPKDTVVLPISVDTSSQHLAVAALYVQFNEQYNRVGDRYLAVAYNPHTNKFVDCLEENHTGERLNLCAAMNVETNRPPPKKVDAIHNLKYYGIDQFPRCTMDTLLNGEFTYASCGDYGALVRTQEYAKHPYIRAYPTITHQFKPCDSSLCATRNYGLDVIYFFANGKDARFLDSPFIGNMNYLFGYSYLTHDTLHERHAWPWYGLYYFDMTIVRRTNNKPEMMTIGFANGTYTPEKVEGSTAYLQLNPGYRWPGTTVDAQIDLTQVDKLLAQGKKHALLPCQ